MNVLSAKGSSVKALLINECPLGLPGAGGVEGHVAALADMLRTAGHEAIVVTGQLRGRSASHSPTVHCLPGLGGPPMRLNLPAHACAQFHAQRQVRAIVRAEKPDVIHIHNLNNALALRALRGMGPTVKTIHDCRPFCSKPRPGVATRLIGNSEEFCDITMGTRCWQRCYARAARHPRERLDAWSYFPNNLLALREVQSCDRILVVSRYLHDLALAAGTPPHKVETLHLFTDAEGLEPEKVATQPQVPYILFSGRLVPEKGILQLLDAFASLPPLPFELNIAGDGPLRDLVAARAAQLAPTGRVRLLGYLDRASMLRRCASCSLLVFPSIGSEGCGLTGVEAMYFGVPVVAFDVGGVQEWLVHGVNGLLVPRNNVAALGRAMGVLLHDAGLRQKMGAAARDYVRRKFRRELHLNGLLDVYRRVAQEQPAKQARATRLTLQTVPRCGTGDRV